MGWTATTGYQQISNVVMFGRMVLSHKTKKYIKKQQLKHITEDDIVLIC
jgi:hypothetical protein